MKRALRWALLIAACGRSDAPRPAEPLGPPTALLGEYFDLAGVRCRAATLRQRLREEPPRRADVRVARDVRTLDVALECARDGASAVDAEAVLAQGVSVTLVGPDGRIHPVRLARDAARAEAEATPSTWALLSFELEPHETTPVVRHTFDVARGAFRATAAAAPYTLRLVRDQERVEAQLRYRFEGPALEHALAAIGRALGAGSGLVQLGSVEGAEALTAMERAYRELHERYAPRALRMEPVPAEGAQIALGIVPAELARRSELSAPLRIALRLVPHGGGYQIASAEGAPELERAVRCAALEAELAEDVRALTRERRTDSAECSVLGTRLPFQCDDVPTRLRTSAQRVGEACGAHPLPSVTARPAPADFQLALRRGRRGRASARAPRFTLVIFRNGSVVFHSHSSRDDSERSDGRTPEDAVARLYGVLSELHFLERRGGEFDPTRCSPSSDEGDVITVIAEGRERMAIARDGCRGPFSADELERVANAALAVGGIEGFTAARAHFRDDPRERVWSVSAE